MFEIVLTGRTSTSRRLLRGGLVLLVVAVVHSTLVIAIIQTHLSSSLWRLLSASYNFSSTATT